MRSASALLLLLLCLGWSPAARAVMSQGLDYMIVAVNDQRLFIRTGESLKLVRGDSFLIEEVSLANASPAGLDVNVVGYSRPKEKGRRSAKPLDDRGVLIDSGKDLQPKYSFNGKGDRYKIDIRNATGPVGTLELELVEPEFQYAEVLVNDRLVVARVGETLTLSPTDRVKVRRVVTNVTDDRTVRFQIDETGEIAEMQLFRGSSVFARIPLSQKLSSLP